MKQLFEVSYYDGLYNTFDIFCDFSYDISSNYQIMFFF